MAKTDPVFVALAPLIAKHGADIVRKATLANTTTPIDSPVGQLIRKYGIHAVLTAIAEHGGQEYRSFPSGIKTNPVLIALVIALGGRAFTKHDWDAFASCDSDDPHIVRLPNGVYALADGLELVFMPPNGDESDECIMLETHQRATPSLLAGWQPPRDEPEPDILTQTLREEIEALETWLPHATGDMREGMKISLSKCRTALGDPTKPERYGVEYHEGHKPDRHGPTAEQGWYITDITTPGILRGPYPTEEKAAAEKITLSSRP